MVLTPAVFFLVACAAAGFGITYFFGIAFRLEERIVFGVVFGPMAAAAFGFLPSLVVRDVNVGTALFGLAASLVVGGAALFTSRATVAGELSRARIPWPLLGVLAVCGAWSVHFFHQAYVYRPEGVYSGFFTIWGDWAAHLSYAGSFAYGHNFPPEFPVDPGHRLGYPFMIDFLAAELVPLGMTLTEALTATSAMLALAFPGVLYLAAARFLSGRVGAVFAVFIFLLSGGLGFVYLLDRIRPGLIPGGPPPTLFTQDASVNLQWLNPVLAYMVPQRSTLFGYSLVLILVLVVWLALREDLGRRPFLVAGLVVGIMPVFNVHAYGTMVALPALWALANKRSEWWAFFVPALVVGVPILAWMWPPDNTSICGDMPSIARYCVQPGWLAFMPHQSYEVLLLVPEVAWFWLWNTSLLLPLVIAGHVLVQRFPNRFPNWYAPMWLWFIVPNLVVLQPWVWDNTKFFILWALLGSVVAGGVLALLVRWRRPIGAVVTLLVLVVTCLSGFLDLASASDFKSSAVLFTDAGGLRVADWVRHNTIPTALFVVADDHNNPIPTLGGRRELIGYSGWLWTYGLADYVRKGQDNKRILDGDPTTPELIREYGVDYVMIGPQEIAQGASRAYWDEHGAKVYDDGEYAVYEVTR